MSSTTEIIMEEIEALQAIMMDEVIVHYNESDQPVEVEVTVTPATAQNVEKQHVRVTLITILPSNYPEESPSIRLRNPRGIDENVLSVIETECRKKCEEYFGLPVIYELIEVTREKLTANNTPSCPCAICLHHFMKEDHFTKTPCFHYFHSHCLGRYIVNFEETMADEEKLNSTQPTWMVKEKKQVICPICRESLNDDLEGDHLLKKQPPLAADFLEDFCSESPEFLAMRKKMESLFLHQKSLGGIIDLEEEKNKYLVSANADAAQRTHMDTNYSSPNSSTDLTSGESDRRLTPHKLSNDGEKRGKKQIASRHSQDDDKHLDHKNIKKHYHVDKRYKNHSSKRDNRYTSRLVCDKNSLIESGQCHPKSCVRSANSSCVRNKEVPLVIEEPKVRNLNRSGSKNVSKCSPEAHHGPKSSPSSRFGEYQRKCDNNGSS